MSLYDRLEEGFRAYLSHNFAVQAQKYLYEVCYVLAASLSLSWTVLLQSSILSSFPATRPHSKCRYICFTCFGVERTRAKSTKEGGVICDKTQLLAIFIGLHRSPVLAENRSFAFPSFFFLFARVIYELTSQPGT